MCGKCIAKLKLRALCMARQNLSYKGKCWQCGKFVAHTLPCQSLSHAFAFVAGTDSRQLSTVAFHCAGVMPFSSPFPLQASRMTHETGGKICKTHNCSLSWRNLSCKGKCWQCVANVAIHFPTPLPIVVGTD